MGVVSGRERFSSFIRRPFSPKHETANQQDRPAWTVFSSSSAPRSGTIGNHRRRSFYILVYNSFWLAPVAPRRTICDEVSEIPAVVDSESHGSNMGFVGESGVCSFSENWRRHGTGQMWRNDNSPVKKSASYKRSSIVDGFLFPLFLLKNGIKTIFIFNIWD